MRNKLIALIVLMLFATAAYGQTPRALVSTFGANLTSWAETRDDSYIVELYDLSTQKSPHVIVSDKLVHLLAQKNNYGGNKSYRWESYESWLQKEIAKGLRITVSNVKDLPASEVYAVNGKASAYQYATCHIKIEGTINLTEDAVFVIANNRIAKIDDYQEKIDSRTGRRRVKIDLDFENDYDSSWGVMYNYGINMPVGLTVDATIGHFYLGMDLGIPTDRPEYRTMKIYRLVDFINYKAKKGVYKPYYYFTFSFGCYFKYVSASVGLGYMHLFGKEYQSKYSGSSADNFSGYTMSTSASKYKFMVKPSIKGYIPCNNRVSISLGVGYDYVLGYTDLNGFNFGLGLRCGF